MSDTTPLQATSEAYTFLGRALLEGLTFSDLRVILPDALVETDVLEVEHFQLFGMNIYPYADVFLSADGLKGGAESEATTAFYARIGWNAATSEVDHIGTQLIALGWLTGAEADALEDSQAAQVARIQALRRDFLDQRVLTWLPALSLAVLAQKSPYYAEVVELALALVTDDRAALGDNLMVTTRPPFELPAPPDILADPKTSLRDIADYLMIPAWSGIALSRYDVGQIAARHELPTGFTDRKTMLHNILRASVNYGTFPALMGDLCQMVELWRDDFHEYAKHPALKAGCSVWAARAAQTLMLLQHIAQAGQLNE